MGAILGAWWNARNTTSSLDVDALVCRTRSHGGAYVSFLFAEFGSNAVFFAGGVRKPKDLTLPALIPTYFGDNVQHRSQHVCLSTVPQEYADRIAPGTCVHKRYTETLAFDFVAPYRKLLRKNTPGGAQRPARAAAEEGRTLPGVDEPRRRVEKSEAGHPRRWRYSGEHGGKGFGIMRAWLSVSSRGL